MYIGLYLKYSLILSDLKETLIFSADFSKNPQISKFMKNRPMREEFFRMKNRPMGEEFFRMKNSPMGEEFFRMDGRTENRRIDRRTGRRIERNEEKVVAFSILGKRLKLNYLWP